MTMRLLPMVAWSPEGTGAGAEALGTDGRAVAVSKVDGTLEGRVGSGAWGVVLPGWFGFHMMSLIPSLLQMVGSSVLAVDGDRPAHG